MTATALSRDPVTAALGSRIGRRPLPMLGGLLAGLLGAVVLIWVPFAWPLVFVGILASHIRHTVLMSGHHRWWHLTHCLMAVSMAYMFLPSSMDALGIAAFWQLAFAAAAAAVLIWMAAARLHGQVVNRLWAIAFVDLAAMVYMWSMSSFIAPVTWALVAYFALQTVLWATDRHDDSRHAEPLVGEMDLRLTMSLMSLGMAYMFAIMQI
jgi:MFS family permease